MNQVKYHQVVPFTFNYDVKQMENRSSIND